MSLSQALATAISGLRVNQSGLSLIASNVANAGTPGYVRKDVNQVEVGNSGSSISVDISGIQREIDQYVQRQLRAENAGATYADTRSQLFQQLQNVYGQPGAANALDTVYNNFTSAVQALSSSPDDSAAQNGVISAAQLLAQQLNQASGSIQSLRSNAEADISDAVNQANEALGRIADLNQKLAASSGMDGATAAMLDQRDGYIDQLSQLMDINVVQTGNNQVSIFTGTGVQLVGTQAAQLSFDSHGSLTPDSLWSADPSKRGVGTITLTSANGSAIDLVQTNAIRSGRIAADLQMRDQDLVQAQTQLDAFAANMATALSNHTTAGSAVTSGAQSGFDVDIGNLSAGNTITLNYTDTLSNKTHTLTFMRVDDPSVLPLSDGATAAAGDKVVGIDFSGGMGAVLAQINQAIASTGMTAANPSGTTLRILNDGAGNRVAVNSLSATATVSSLSGGSAELPLFTDGSQLYTGAVTAAGAQSNGFAARISLNAALAADPSKLVGYAATAAAGDSTRPDFIYRQLTSNAQVFSPDTGIGSASAPFSGSISTFLRQVLSQQGEAASAADSLKQGQDIVLSSLQQRFNQTSGVNIDEEMTNLLTLQNSYAANARVLSTVSNMFNALMNM